MQPSTSAIIALNQKIDRINAPWALTETHLDNWLHALEDTNAPSQPLYRLTLARLMELTILLAGNHADTCEYRAAGDLLINPRKILIHRKHAAAPIVKSRHQRLTEQLCPNATHPSDAIQYIQQQTILEIVSPPLLPLLFDKMSQSGQFSAAYLQQIEACLKKIADTLSFLNAWSVRTFPALRQRMQQASPETRQFVEAHLCRFNHSRLNRIQHQITELTRTARTERYLHITQATSLQGCLSTINPR